MPTRDRWAFILKAPLVPDEKSKFLGSGGSTVTRLNLKGIDGRAPPGMEPTAEFDSMREISLGLDMVKMDRLRALS